MSSLEFLRIIKPRVDLAALLRNTRDLWQTELGQTFDAYHAAARLAEERLREIGCEKVERIAFPADGKTVYQDRTMPLGWRATRGRLEIVKSAAVFADPVIADFERHPFHLVKGSVSTPSEGVVTRLISEEDLYAGADARGALILFNPEHRPIGRKFRQACDAGALGFVTDHLPHGRHETPEAIQWINAGTEGPSWHTRADDRPFIGFVVSPYIGDQLRVALRAGEVTVRAISDGERYEDHIDVVTGTLPGEDRREVWLLAHLYEPLANDNSSGVACVIEILRVLRELMDEGLLPRPRFTLRVVFGMESYGFAAYAERRGGWLADQVLCAMNVDGLPITDSTRGMGIIFSQSCCPSSVDYALEELTRADRAPLLETPPVSHRQTEGIYGDDLLLGDSTVGVPSLWVWGKGLSKGVKGQRFWHSSEQTMSLIIPEKFRDTAALLAAWTAATLTGSEFQSQIRRAVKISRKRLEEEQERILEILRTREPGGRASSPLDWLDFRLEIESARLRDFLRFGAEAGTVERAVDELSALAVELRKAISKAGIPEYEDQVWKMAESFVVRRVARGLPHDLAAAPRAERIPELMSLGYGGPAAIVLAHADGHRNVADLLLRAQWEERCFYSRKEVRACLAQLRYFAEYGCIGLTGSRVITKVRIVQALRATGIREGDLVMLHSGLSAFGMVEGKGSDTVIDALLEVLGPEGTLLMPTFVQSWLCFEKGPARNREVIPYHKDAPIFTGTIPNAFLKRAGVFRSAHVSHSVAGIGPLAERCLLEHGATDAPVGKTSPWAQLHELGGKMVFLGAPLSACAFLHYLEDEVGADYLETAICVVKDETGGQRLVTVPRHLPGPRDFYNPETVGNSKIFCWLESNGLKIKREILGFSDVKVIEAAALHHLGLKALRENPGVLI
ncbi:MAG TPA: AAC(3) family N-acetyltransferase [Chthoniobacteraceae bacterium]|nr:AAC(3) family N-acetyltransferase [Chthoniobacteraceae bacterium]